MINHKFQKHVVWPGRDRRAMGTGNPRDPRAAPLALSQAPLGHGQAMARSWPGPGQARPGNISVEMMVT